MQFIATLFKQFLVLVFCISFVSSWGSFGSEKGLKTPHEKAGGCPYSMKCPFYFKVTQNEKTNLTKNGNCPLRDKCPYFDEHINDESLADGLTTKDHKCPLSKGNCPFYKSIKKDKANLMDIDWKNAKCPLAKKCSYYDEISKDPSQAFKCPVIRTCPHFWKSDHGHQVHHDTPRDAADKCPFLKTEKESHKHHGCPLKEKNCPYFDKHKNDKGHVCPMAAECPMFEKFKKHHATVDNLLKGPARCPVAEKCPYYGKLKEDRAGAKKQLSKCPHFADGEIKKCPFFGEAKEHQCPMADKCPVFNDIKSGKVKLEDLANAPSKCPLAEKCPYYQQLKKDPHAAKEEVAKCPHLSAGDVKKCPYLDQKAEHEKAELPKGHPKVDLSGSKECPYKGMYDKAKKEDTEKEKAKSSKQIDGHEEL